MTSCNGQTKSNINANSQPNSKLISIGQPKIVKTQGSSESDNIHCSLQDRLGNLWLGTTGQGVYRYDGKLFYTYTVKEGLSSNSVWSILEDKVGNIWFGTGDGICRYDGKKLSQFQPHFPLNLLSVPIIILINPQKIRCGVCCKTKVEKFGLAPEMEFTVIMG